MDENHLFSLAVEIEDIQERSAFLAQRCRDDSALRQRVEDMLAAHDRSLTISQVPPKPAAGDLNIGPLGSKRDQPAERIGPYRLLQLLGEGGMGAVYQAEQDRPVRRRVAIKIIKPGMDNRQIIARFDVERQALALMSHEHIAKVFDAGTTDEGRPYFVMELVQGLPITEYCDKHRLSTEQRLHLMIPVCQAIQHAHQKGVIHRDIKPSNVLVVESDAGPVPKVIDFGLAKALQQPLTESTQFTQIGQILGTLEYMSPEQAELKITDIDTRTDVYSLGVMLYELLAGSTPIGSGRLKSEAFDRILQLIREEEPPRPSIRISDSHEAIPSLAARRRAEPSRLSHLLRGDLDAIVMKALDKDRARRYDSATGLAADIDRYLSHEPIEARPPSAAYRLRKMAQKYRGAVMATIAFVGLLLGATVLSTWQAIRAHRAETLARNATEDAQQRADELEQVVQFQAEQLGGIDVQLMGVRLRQDLLVEARRAMEMLASNDDELSSRAEQLETLLAGTSFTDLALRTLDRNIFETALEAVEKQFEDQPLVQARLLDTIAETMRALGLYEQMETPQLASYAIRRRILGDDHPDTLTSTNAMGTLHEVHGRFDEADRFMSKALEGRRRILGDDHPDTLTSINALGYLRLAQGRQAEAESLYHEALDGRRRVLGNEHEETLQSINNIGFLLFRQGKFDQAGEAFREALDGRQRVLGPQHPATLTSMNNLASVLQFQKRFDEARPLCELALEGAREVMGEMHPLTLTWTNNMAALLKNTNQLNEAEDYFQKALEGSRKLFGATHPDTLTYAHNIACLKLLQGQLGEAEASLREVIESRRRVLGDEHHNTLLSIDYLGVVLHEQGKLDEAEDCFREALKGRRQVLGKPHGETLKSIRHLAAVLNEQQRFEEAKDLLDESLAEHIERYGEQGVITANVRLLTGAALIGLEQYDRAEPLLLNAYEVLQADDPAPNRKKNLRATVEALTDLYVRWDKQDERARWKERLNDLENAPIESGGSETHDQSDR